MPKRTDDDFGERLRSMTMRDWLERVCELQNAVEARDRRLGEQERAIENQLRTIQRLRAEIVRLGGDPSYPASTPANRPTKGAHRRPK